MHNRENNKMSDTKFTKGPWGWEHDDSTSSVIQVFSEADEAKGDPDICRLQHEPDAYLIAAAPEMYKMLESLSSMSTEDAKLYLENSSDLVDLLAKARGES